VGKRHLVVPDCQVRPGVPLEHLTWIGNYAAEKKPDSLIVIGDFADMASLSSYDVGKKSFEGRTYKADIEVANDAFAQLMRPIDAEIMRCFRRKIKRWDLNKELTLGNHEDRTTRAIELDRKLEGTISLEDLRYASFGFRVHPFLQPVVVDGVAYCHYFSSGVMGRPITTARALLTKLHMSCFAGHQQDRDIAYAKRADGKRMTSIICGSCYLHDEDYLNPQTNNVWRGVFVLNEVDDGSFDEMPVSLDYLREKYA
jgi:hypothetical protein